MKKMVKKLVAMGCISTMMLSSIVGCSSSKTESTGSDKTATTGNATEKKEDTTVNDEVTEAPYKLSIMAMFASDEDDQDPLRQKIYQNIRDYTNTDVEFIFYPDTMYWEKIPLILASADLPSIMVVNKTSDIENAVMNDTFWEITDYIDNYDNLKHITDVARENASYNGKLFGVPRARAVGRNGVGYRLDWLENLGMKEPETIEDFYNMLVAFTYNDPDRNGKDDTFGLAVTSYAGSWDIMQTWFGVPNGWGEQADGTLLPAHMTPQYDEALKFFRKIYSEGLVNQDFATYDPSKWDEMLRGGMAGAAADVVDRARRNQDYFDKEGIPAKTNIVGGFEGPEGLKLLPTSGFAGMLVFSKSEIKNEEELQKALSFVDKLSDAEMLNLIEWGYEDEYWYMGDEGYGIRYTQEEKPDVKFNMNKGLNQITSYIVSPENEAERIPTAPLTPIRQIEADVQVNNEQYVVVNPAASYSIPIVAEVGAQLDEIIATARIQYITGEIDEVGLQSAKDRWLKNGGQEIIDGFNEIHKSR